MTQNQKNHSVIITRADEVLDTLSRQPVAAVLSIEHPGVEKGGHGAAPRIDEHNFTLPQLILTFWDSEQPVSQGPDKEQIKQGLDFAAKHIGQGTVLIHCNAGKARSAALALGVMAQACPDESEKDLIDRLLEIRPIAAPNILVMEMVDELTNRNGKLLQAVKDHPVLSANRKAAEERRLAYLQKNPDLLKKLNPEKFPQPKG